MKVLITAGPTREALDPVRYLTNRSSGKMGYALAAAAVEDGHEVVLISGPVGLAVPEGVKRISVESAHEMFEAVAGEIGGSEVAIFAAAVADYRPVVVAAQKMKKGVERMTLELERTEDILGSARGPMGFGGILVGFAAETERLMEHALDKLRRKGCDLVIANDVSQVGIGFDSEENAVTLCWASGEVRELARQAKETLAKVLIDEILKLSRAHRDGGCQTKQP